MGKYQDFLGVCVSGSGRCYNIEDSKKSLPIFAQLHAPRVSLCRVNILPTKGLPRRPRQEPHVVVQVSFVFYVDPDGTKS